MNLLAVSLAPVLIILLYIYTRDKYEKEPLSLCLKLTFLGALATIPILGVEYFLMSMGQGTIYTAFVVAGFTEEFFKFIVLYFFAYKRPEYNEPFDGIVYAVFTSLGFAAVENVLYVLKGGITTGMLRMFTAVPAHAIFGVAMGYHMSKAKFQKSPLFWALLIPIILHGVYDAILLRSNEKLLLIFIPYILYIFNVSFKLMKKASNDSPFKF